MFPPRWMIDPCMNIDVKTDSYQGIPSTTPVRWPHAISPPPIGTNPQCVLR